MLTNPFTDEQRSRNAAVKEFLNINETDLEQFGNEMYTHIQNVYDSTIGKKTPPAPKDLLMFTKAINSILKDLSKISRFSFLEGIEKKNTT